MNRYTMILVLALMVACGGWWNAVKRAEAEHKAAQERSDDAVKNADDAKKEVENLTPEQLLDIARQNGWVRK